MRHLQNSLKFVPANNRSPKVVTVKYRNFCIETFFIETSCCVYVQVYTWILKLGNPETREHALIELSRKREVVPDLAPMLWHSFGTMSALLQEIVMIYPVINPPTLTVCSIIIVTRGDVNHRGGEPSLIA